MINDGKIFIVVPIYNVGEIYFKKCIESLKKIIDNNTYVIFVNDDSKMWEKERLQIPNRDNYIILENKKNQGLGPTRNIGFKYIFENFEITKNDYVLFLDSDDELTKKIIFKLRKKITKNKFPDIIRFLFLHKHKNLYCRYFLPIFNSNKKEKYKDFYDTSWSCAYNALWIKENELYFDVSRFPHEDVYYCLITSSCANSIVSCNVIGYIYNFNRENSITNIWNRKKITSTDAINYIKYISYYLERAYLFIKNKNNYTYLENAKFYFQKFEHILCSDRLANVHLNDYEEYANKIENIFKKLDIRYWDKNKKITNKDKFISNKINFYFIKKCLFIIVILFNLIFRKFTI